MVAMYSLELFCTGEEADRLSGELWEQGTAGIREEDAGEGRIRLIAGFEISDFEQEETGNALLLRFSTHEPRWYEEAHTDWVEQAKNAWPGMLVGKRFFVCPPWSKETTPDGRSRLIHNPGLACGTGDHPCTRLAIEALEEVLTPGARVADIGTGSGIVTVAALLLDASGAVGIDPDENAIRVARDNLQLNGFSGLLVTGFTDALAPGWADVTAANISATVLVEIMDDLVRITRPGGMMVLTGFTEPELAAIQALAGKGQVSSQEEWRCLVVRVPEPFGETGGSGCTSLLSEE